MKLKLKAIVGAVMAIGSASSFAAAAPLPCPTTVVDQATAETFVKNCVVGQTLFIGGASTLKSNGATLIANLFDTSASKVVKIIDQGSVSGKNGNVVAYFGMSKASLTTTSKPLLAIYNYNNGSAAGVSQLLAKPDAVAVPESDVVSVGSTKNVANALCSSSVAVTAVAGSQIAITAGTDAAPSVTCTSHSAKQADVAISDVRAQELYALYGTAKNKLSTLSGTALFSQSFGVSVSWPLYQALQTAQGLVAGSTLPANQPSITRATYASLVSKTGAVKSLAALVGGTTPPTDLLTLARRDDLSGTQASSNIFFVNGQCGGNGRQTVLKSLDLAVAKAGGLGGGLAIAELADSTANLNILAAVVSDTVKAALATTTGYAIGVTNVGTAAAITAAKANFVKIDGISPNYYGGNADSRSQLISGEYPFALTSFAYTVTAAMTKSPEKAALAAAVIGGFKDSTQLNGGLAYFDGGAASVQAKAKRAGDNNCSPIVKL